MSNINYKFADSIKFTPYRDQVNTQLALQTGLMKQNAYNQGKAELENSVNTLMQIPSLSGKDTEMKMNILNGLQEDLKKIGGKDYSDPKINSQINAHVNKYLESGDLVNIAQRAYKKQELFDKYKELTKDGSTMNPWDMAGLLEINDYENSGNYIKDKSFNGDVYKSVDFNKVYDDTFKNMEEMLISSRAVPKDWRGYTEESKGKFKKQITDAVTTALKNDPNTYGAIQRMSDYTLKDQNKTASQVYQEKLTQAKQAAYTAYLSATEAGDNSKRAETYNKLQEYDKQINALNIPGADNLAKRWMTDDLIEQKANEFADAHQYEQRTYKVDQYAMEDYKYSQDIDKMIFQARLDRLGYTDKHGNIIPPKPETGKNSVDLSNELQDLEDVKVNYLKRYDIKDSNGFYRLSVPPGIFMSEAFIRKDVLVPDKYDETGNPTAFAYKPSEPMSVWYNPDKDQFQIHWEDRGEPDKMKEVTLKGIDGVKSYLTGKSPSYAKLLAKKTTVQTGAIGPSGEISKQIDEMNKALGK